MAILVVPVVLVAACAGEEPEAQPEAGRLTDLIDRLRGAAVRDEEPTLPDPEVDTAGASIDWEWVRERLKSDGEVTWEAAPSPQPLVGQQVQGEDGCLYQYSEGGVWNLASPVCIEWTAEKAGWVYNHGEPANEYWFDETNPHITLLYFRDQWVRVAKSGGGLEIYSNGHWISDQEYSSQDSANAMLAATFDRKLTETMNNFSKIRNAPSYAETRDPSSPWYVR